MYFHDSHFECLQFKNSQDARKIEVARKKYNIIRKVVGLGRI